MENLIWQKNSQKDGEDGDRKTNGGGEEDR